MKYISPCTVASCTLFIHIVYQWTVEAWGRLLFITGMDGCMC